ncbi:DUF1800 domain-containing protein [Tundrisphaera lichenicola]|uniref:DUF1800 domain-containing protein n=1 Tax=Tundrisphaera lichenicola TaxID=2029860 RepID=UPI003EBDEC92
MRPTDLRNEPARAWSSFEPGPDRPWDLSSVAHLHRRAGFGAPWKILTRDLSEGPAASVDLLIEGEPTGGDGQSASEFAAFLDAMGSRLGSSADPRRLRGIWLYRMIHTPRPLLERMTLFWHDHFATSIVKVSNPSAMQRQNALLRANALGNFKELLDQVGKDPAMLIWLDATANRRARPNENYAREVMELFSLGRGHYTESDIREAARALTGRFVTNDRFSVLPAQHDGGVKTILGRTGNFSGDDLPSILLDQPSCAEFLARKLFRQFISEVDSPSDALIAPLAASFRESGYDIKATVRMILRSNLFHDPATRRKRVKSPVELTIGAIRSLEALKPTVSADALGDACSRMGQALYAPPSVAGWEGGPSWINSASLIARTNFALGLLSKDDRDFGGRTDPTALAARHGFAEPAGASKFLLDLLAPDAFDPGGRERLLTRTPSDVASVVLTSPEYQLA